VIALGFLLFSLIGETEKKEEKLPYKSSLIYSAAGLIIYFFSYYFLLSKLFITIKTVIYIGLTGAGFLLF
jgi:hypothetical protein